MTPGTPSNGSRPSTPDFVDGRSADKPSSTVTASPTQQQRNKAVVVGGGWAGYAAALALAKAGAEVTLLDASENPGGLSSAFTTPGGQMVEPGIKGFWYQVN